MEEIEHSCVKITGAEVATVCGDSDLGYIMVQEGSKQMQLHEQLMKSDEELFTRCACDVFAWVLGQKYGYSICEIQNRGELSHVFCVTEREGQRYGVDITGEYPENYFFEKYKNHGQNMDLPSLREKIIERFVNGNKGLDFIVARAEAAVNGRNNSLCAKITLKVALYSGRFGVLPDSFGA